MMKMRLCSKFCLRTVALCVVIAASCSISAGSVKAGPLQLHPNGQPLPTDQQGPFVTTGDGGVLCIDSKQAHHSVDEGKTWSAVPLFQDPTKFDVSNERALLRTKEGTIISAWMNLKERRSPSGWDWGGADKEITDFNLPTYVCRSLDDGKTWEEPIRLQDIWCGCIHSLIQTRSGRIVLVGQTVIPQWRHATVIYVSDDQGKTWQTSNILDYGAGRHDHAGSCEATVLERADGSLHLLLRTESGYFYEAQSEDGLNWVDLQKSNVPSVTCCGNMYRLADGRAVLLWNHPLRSQPTNRRSREELSIAFSNDDGKTWEDRTVIATRYERGGEGPNETRVSYPYLYERQPGELWITTMQGNLRMKIQAADITKAEFPLPESIVMLGDSTTAFRRGVKLVTSNLVAQALGKAGSPLTVINRGVPSSTTSGGLSRLQAEASSLNAKLVVVQFGINDSIVDVWKNPPAKAPRVALKAYEANLRKIVEVAQQNDVKVILMTTNPIRWGEKMKELYGKPPYDVNAEDGLESLFLPQYNAVVRALAEEMQVPLIDVHQAFLDAAKAQGTSVSDLLLDGVNPNDAGHAVTAKALIPVIQQVLEQ